MYDYGHFCILILAQGNWKSHFKDQLINHTSKVFLDQLIPRSKQEEIRIGFNETPREPLFEPGLVTEKTCHSCSVVHQILETKRGVNEGLILFSHSLPDRHGVTAFLNHILTEPRIRKAYYLELGFGEDLGLDEVPNVEHVQLPLAELVKLIENDQFRTKTLYDILKLKY